MSPSVWTKVKALSSGTSTNKKSSQSSSQQQIAAWPSARMRLDDQSYSLSTFIFDDKNTAQTPLSELYLKTRSTAIMRYCLFENDHEKDFADASRLYLSRSEHQRLILRFRRCGAVALRFREDTGSQGAFACIEDLSMPCLARHIHSSWQYTFGWPPIEEERSPESVWVLEHSKAERKDIEDPCDVTNKSPIPNMADLRQFAQELDSGIEGLINLPKLGDASTMVEYCAMLKKLGATYYADVKNCPEARERGLVSAASIDGTRV